MSHLVSVLISTTHRRLISAFAKIVTFAIVLAIVSAYALHKTAEVAQEQSRAGTEQFLILRNDLQTIFAKMHTEITAEPCSAAFQDQLRRIAYLPDGLNEFLYAPGGKAQCSTHNDHFNPPVDFGVPDIDASINSGISLWIDRDLGFLGLTGMTGTFALSDPFVAIIPPRTFNAHPAPWLAMEMVLVGPNGSWFHRAGETGIYQHWLADADASALWRGRLSKLICAGVRCVTIEANLGRLMTTEKVTVAFILIAVALISIGISTSIDRLIARLWSFEARFRRHLDARHIVCAYQPVMHLESGEITGCEVLVRWRDIDNSIVFPDRFLGIVERHDMTMRLTQLVADRACEELSRNVPPERRLMVSFNIFPRDLNCARLLKVFAGFLARPERFDLVLEIIESDEIPANAQAEIAALRRAGVRTYIDDFGAGYSNIGSLAALSVDGVKLDRSFAMAPDDSMMAQMLRHAIKMIQTTGCKMVIEGVETAERLELLRSMSAGVNYVQGYYIARPLDAAAFAAFIAPPQHTAGQTTGKPPAKSSRYFHHHIQARKFTV